MFFIRSHLKKNIVLKNKARSDEKAEFIPINELFEVKRNTVIEYYIFFETASKFSWA
jgi:hypothetical protein